MAGKTPKKYRISRWVLLKRRISGFWVIYKKNKLGLLGLGILIFFALIAIFADIIAPYSYTDYYVGGALEPPSSRFILGTDELGRDLFSILILSSRISLLVGIVAALFTVVIGTLIGLVSGYFGGKVDEALMRITDVFLMLPGLPLLIVFAAILGPGVENIILVISIISWPGTARAIRSQVLSLKERPFVEAARAAGASELYILFKHILPNVAPLIFAYVVLNVPSAIIAEASLSFLGFGDPTRPSWGVMLQFAWDAGAIYQWNYIIPPGLCITLVAFAFALIGYAMDEILNPRLRAR